MVIMSYNPINLFKSTNPEGKAFEAASPKEKSIIWGKYAVTTAARTAFIAVAVFAGIAAFSTVMFKIKVAWTVCVITNALMASVGVDLLSYKFRMARYTEANFADATKFIVTA